MGLGSLNSPNVGLFPFLIGCLLGLLAAVRLCASLFSKSAIHAPKISIPFARILPLLACLFAYVLLMNEVGFILSSFFLVVFLLKVIEPKPWLVTLPLGVGISLGAYFVFRVLLGIQLPEGILAF
jgi:putative tricarboxylic transport membrane protein